MDRVIFKELSKEDQEAVKDWAKLSDRHLTVDGLFVKVCKTCKKQFENDVATSYFNEKLTKDFQNKYKNKSINTDSFSIFQDDFGYLNFRHLETGFTILGFDGYKDITEVSVRSNGDILVIEGEPNTNKKEDFKL